MAHKIEKIDKEIVGGLFSLTDLSHKLLYPQLHFATAIIPVQQHSRR